MSLSLRLTCDGPAHTSDVTQAHALLHGEEKLAFGDAGYQGIQKRQENEDFKDSSGV